MESHYVLGMNRVSVYTGANIQNIETPMQNLLRIVSETCNLALR